MKESILYPILDTPCVLLDLDKLEADIREMSQLATEAGLKLRPHVKIHESAAIAKLQVEAGAIGIELGSIDQVEPMAEAGIKDILVAHPFYGAHKFETLKKILTLPNLKLTFVVDMLEHAEGISRVAVLTGVKVPVVIKLETGGNRLGVLPGEPVLNLAKQILQLPGIEFKGIYAHEVYSEPTNKGADKEAFRVATITVETARLLKKEGIEIDHISVGASPTFRATCLYLKHGKFRDITEIHPGKLVIDDIAQVMMQDSHKQRRALSVLTTVISTSHPSHAVIDAGFKTFGFDSLIGYRDQPGFFWEGKPSFGSVKDRPDLWLGALHAEVSRLFYKDPSKKLRLGERLEIIPNNATLVIHMHEKLYGVRDAKIETVIPVKGSKKTSES